MEHDHPRHVPLHERRGRLMHLGHDVFACQSHCSPRWKPRLIKAEAIFLLTRFLQRRVQLSDKRTQLLHILVFLHGAGLWRWRVGWGQVRTARRLDPRAAVVEGRVIRAGASRFPTAVQPSDHVPRATQSSLSRCVTEQTPFLLGDWMKASRWAAFSGHA